MKNILLGLVAILAPTIFYELFLEILLSIGLTDISTIKVINVALYVALAFILTVLVFENIKTKNKLLTTLGDILSGAALFIIAYPSWVSGFYFVVSFAIVMWWNDRYKKKSKAAV